MNQLTCTGHLGHDASAKTVNGQACITFSLAVSTGYGDNKRTQWYDVTQWRDAPKLLPYLTKGAAVLVQGQLQAPRIYQDRSGRDQVGLSITAANIELLGSKKDQADAAPAVQPANVAMATAELPAEATADAATSPPKPAPDRDDDGGDLPF